MVKGIRSHRSPVFAALTAYVPLLLASNCATTVAIDRLAQDVMENEISAQRKYYGQLLEMSGTLIEFGFISDDVTVVGGTSRSERVLGGTVADGRSEMRRVARPKPVIWLRSESGTTLVCYLGSPDTVRDLRRGEVVTVRGMFWTFQSPTTVGVREPVLSDCSVVSPRH